MTKQKHLTSTLQQLHSTQISLHTNTAHVLCKHTTTAKTIQHHVMRTYSPFTWQGGAGTGSIELTDVFEMNRQQATRNQNSKTWKTPCKRKGLNNHFFYYTVLLIMGNWFAHVRNLFFMILRISLLRHAGKWYFFRNQIGSTKSISKTSPFHFFVQLYV